MISRLENISKDLEGERMAGWKRTFAGRKPRVESTGAEIQSSGLRTLLLRLQLLFLLLQILLCYPTQVFEVALRDLQKLSQFHNLLMGSH